MRTLMFKSLGTISLLTAGLWAVAAQPAQAAEFYLAAQPFDTTLPDGAVVRMWGYAACDASWVCGLPTSPGPTLRTGGEAQPVALTIHLRNDLPVPTSLIMPAQLVALTPVKFVDPSGRERARAFTAEVAPGSEATFSWPGLRAGTFLYHSGSQPQVQVQMGLLGALVNDVAAGEAYPGVTYDSDVVITYSEIDPALHAAVRDGSYGTALYPSTFDYKPTYFLVNGAPYQAGDAPIDTGAANRRVLLRLLNGGLLHRAPQLLGSHLSWLAENGHLAPFAEQRYSALVPAGGVRDALFVAPGAGTFALYDRMLNLTTNQATGGGMYAFLLAGEAAPVILVDNTPAPQGAQAPQAGAVSSNRSTTATRQISAAGGRLLRGANKGWHGAAPRLAADPTEHTVQSGQVPRVQPRPASAAHALASGALAPLAVAPVRRGTPVVVVDATPAPTPRLVVRPGQKLRIVLVKDDAMGRLLDPRTVAIVAPPLQGCRVENHHNGSVTFVAGPTTKDQETFDFTVEDRWGRTLDAVTVVVSIEPPARP